MRIKKAKETLLVYENTRTRIRYNFRKVDGHTYVFTNDEGVRESITSYKIKKDGWKFVPDASCLASHRPVVG